MVSFNDEVILIGDGVGETEVIAGDRLDKYDEIV